MHGFRDGAVTELDRIGAPMATRLQRLGHIDPDTTMGCTHAVDEEDRKRLKTLHALNTTTCFYLA
jgi:integrase